MGSATKTVSYRYDANRNRTLMIDPDGGRTTYVYDPLNRITSLINPQGERTTYAYDAKGRRTVKKLANGTRASFTYDATNRLTTLANLKSDNTVISKFDYKYDNVGNRTEVADADGSRVTWSYDDTYQLTGEHRTGTTPYRNTFTYDSVGNRLIKDESGARTTYSYDATNQLKTSIDASGTTTYTFDADGNQELVQAPNNDRTTTVWDYENRTTLVELPTGVRNTVAYEPDGLRVKLEDSTETKKFIWDNQNYLAESDENNDINVVYTNEPNYYGNLISQRRNSATSWYHYEALGSTRELTDTTDAVTDTYLYDASGNVLSSTGTTQNPFQFTGNVGYYFDVDTGNQYIRARIYSPIIGRWMSVDPLGFLDGVNLFLPYFVPNEVDASGTQSRGSRGRRRNGGPKASAKELFEKWLKENGEDRNWWKRLPKCPERVCSKSCGSGRNRTTCYFVPGPDGNRDWGRISKTGYHEKRFHPGSCISMRSKAINGNSNQCTYDCDGNLIRTAPGYGTVDSSPAGLFTGHIADDVNPVYWAAVLDGCWQFGAGFGRLKEGCVGENLKKYFDLRPFWAVEPGETPKCPSCPI